MYCIANISKETKVRGDKQERKKKYTGTQDRGISSMEVYPVVQGCTGVRKSADSVQGRCLQVRGKPMEDVCHEVDSTRRAAWQSTRADDQLGKKTQTTSTLAGTTTTKS